MALRPCQSARRFETYHNRFFFVWDILSMLKDCFSFMSDLLILHLCASKKIKLDWFKVLVNFDHYKTILQSNMAKKLHYFSTLQM